MCELVKLVCIECGDENYYIIKNKKIILDCLEMSKYCLCIRKYMFYREKK